MDRLRRWSHTVAAALAEAYTASGLRDSTGAVLDAVRRVPGRDTCRTYRRSRAS